MDRRRIRYGSCCSPQLRQDLLRLEGDRIRRGVCSDIGETRPIIGDRLRNSQAASRHFRWRRNPKGLEAVHHRRYRFQARRRVGAVGSGVGFNRLTRGTTEVEADSRRRSIRGQSSDSLSRLPDLRAGAAAARSGGGDGDFAASSLGLLVSESATEAGLSKGRWIGD